MKIETDEHVRLVLEYMQDNIPASKLVAVSDLMPKIARLLWEGIPQEPVRALSLTLPKAVGCSRSQEASTESALGRVGADDDSVVEATCR